MSPNASDGRYFEGPVADNRADVASAARTSTGTSTPFNTEDIDEIHAKLAVASTLGTSETLDVALQTRAKGDLDWVTVGSFAQQSAATDADGEAKVFTALGTECRWSWTLGGTAAAAAALTTAVAGSNNDVVWTAVAAGEAGNSITMAYVMPTDTNVAVPASVAVVGTAITVTLGVDTDGSTVVSTADDIKTLVNAHVTAGALVQGADAAANDGSGLLVAMSAAPLTGGITTPTFTFGIDCDIER